MIKIVVLGSVLAGAILLATVSISDAAVLCVGPASSGNGAGTDWNNVKAWSGTPARGDTWYLRDGTYQARKFAVATSGTTFITIKKATSSDHVTDTGWQSSYANQALFNATIEWDSSYWVFDGQTGGGPGNWTNGFGFKVLATNPSSIAVGINIINNAGNVTIKHVEVVGDGGDGDQGFPNNDGIGLNAGTGVVISHAYIHDMGRCPFISLAADGLIVEYVYTGWYEYTANEHSEIASLWGDNQTFRYCVFSFVGGTGGLMFNGNGGAVYGCVFYNGMAWTAGNNGCVGAKSSNEPVQNIMVYNNTVINGTTPFIGMYMPNYPGNVAHNNLFYGSDPGYLSTISHDYNHFVGTSSTGAGHDSTGSGNPFISLNITNANFAKLASNTPPGETLAIPYNQDMFGSIRSTWTRGACEFGSGNGPVISVLPSNKSCGSVLVGETTNVSFTVQNAGGGMLTGAVSVAAPFSVAGGGSYSLGSNQSQSVTIEFSPTAGGSFSQNVTFTGAGGATASVVGVATSPGVNQPPVAAASAGPSVGARPLVVTFSSAGSFDPEGAPLTYIWTFGDGTTSVAANPVHTYQLAGSYSAYVTVSDGTNTTASTNVVVNVINPGSGLVAAYGFEEGSGSSVVDASGNGNSAVVSGATWTTSGRFGKALLFDGVSAMVTVNDSASLDLAIGMTLEAWIYPTTSGGWADIIFKAVDIYYLEGSSQQGAPAMGGLYATGPLYGPTPLQLNVWSHLAATYDGAMMKLFVNGVQVAAQAQTRPITQSNGPLSIGGDQTYGQYWTGAIDEVRIYNRALSAGEIQADMNAPVIRPAPPSNLRIVGQ